ncbi:MAG: FG-GAP-like repeat-containing protein, partial [Candidatus Gracilibacteria bacterium]
MNLIHSNFQKFFCGILVLVFLFTEILSAPVAYALTAIEKADKPGDFEDTYDLITVVVDSEIDKDLNSYAGLKGKYPDKLKENTLGERIIRYLGDLRESNEYTDVQILIFDKKKENAVDLANALENLYFNGNGEKKNRLAGVVLAGNIPLPVVNKNGEKFVSMYPYTDFENKAYVYDSKTLNFEYNPNITFPKPEIWGGVIKADVGGVAGQEELAKFFDKNHLYYAGVPEYADFNKKMFYGDLTHEEESISPDVYTSYSKYLKYWEDLAYMRYNKYWAKDLSEEANGEIGVKEADDSFVNLPDITSKQIIDQFLLPYYKIVSSYIGKAHDLIDGTGRYANTGSDVAAVLVSAKDEYAKTYLRAVNDAIEKKINEVVEKVAAPLPLITSVKLSVNFTKENGDIEVGGNTDINYGYNLSNYVGGANGSHYLNGINYDLLKNAKQCSVYLGSYVPGSKEYSILTRSIRSDDPSTAIPVHTFGVNTRILTENEAKKLTDGKVSSGAIIESNADYGIPAFYPNPNLAMMDYKNYFFGPLQEGDVITKINDKEIGPAYTIDQAAEESYKAVKSVVNEGNKELYGKIENLGYKVLLPSTDYLNAGKVQTAAGNISVEFYHDGQKNVKNFTFSVSKDGSTSFYAPAGTPRLYVLLSTLGFEGTPSADIFKNGTMGAIFTLYSGDIAAGCTMTNTFRNSDRCFYPMTTIPLLDPAGSVGLKKVDFSTKSMFPEKFTGTYENHMNMFQFPDGFDLKNLDEIYFNSCFAPYSTLKTTDGEIYSPLIKSFKNFAKELFNKNPEKAPGKKETWLDSDKIDPSQIVVNNVEGQTVTLKDFSDRYGFFDGIDNDGDKVADFEMKDLLKEDGKPGQDGVFETKVYDFDEAETKYGISDKNLSEISRRMLSKNKSYVLPKDMPGNPYKGDVTLEVLVSNYKNKDGTEKKLSSAVVHNEPTNYTILSQVNAQSTPDLPIDNPRYVAFLSVPVGKALDGKTQKVYYPNIFDAENVAQIKVKLDETAWQIAQIPGAENLVDGKKDLISIHDEIYNKYLAPVVDAQKDDSPDGFVLNAAASQKIHDALSWKGLAMDEKHDYIFSRYLNPDKDAYVGDSSNGYEAAYLVLNGAKDSFKTNFNSKGGLVKTAGGGVEISKGEISGGGGTAGGTAGTSGSSGAESKNSETKKKEGYKFVDLSEFKKEVDEFLDYFTLKTKPEFKAVCVNPDPLFVEVEKEASEDKGIADALGGDSMEFLDSVSLEIIPDSTTLVANGQSKTKISVVFRDKNGKQVNTYSRATVKVDDKISVDSKTDEFQNVDGIQISSFEGSVSFYVYSKDLTGSSTISAYLIDNNFEKISGTETAKIINVVDNLSLTLAAKKYSIKAQLTKNGDVVTGYNGPIEFKILDSKLGKFVPSAPIKMTNGAASDAIFQPYSTAYGDVEIYVSVNGFASSSITLNIPKPAGISQKQEVQKDTSYKYSYDKVAGFNTKSLYVSLLGGDFGNPELEKNTAQAFLQNSYAQAVSADTHVPSNTKKLVAIDGYGKIDVLAEDIEAKILPVSDASENAQKISFENVNTKDVLAEASVKMAKDVKVDVKMLVEDSGYKIEKKSDGFYLTQGIETELKISNEGKISINDNSFELRLPEEDDELEIHEFSLIVTKNSQDFALVTFNGKKEVKFTLISGDTRYDFEQFFSRADTSENKGLYLLDKDSLAAPFSENVGAGFKYKDKQMLYFAAGNSVGESSVPYGSEYGIIYGDPNVRVGKNWLADLVSKFSGYTKDIGTPVFQGDDDIYKLINFDFNGDGKDDILLAYEDGLVRLLEYEGGHKKFRDKGYILNITGGIYSTAKIDSNNDGYDDLVVGTKEPCKATDKCVSLFVNNATKFERKSLNLNVDGKIYEMKGYDMNKDGCDDLVASDSSANVRVFYNSNDGKSCKGLETNYGNSFGFGYGINADTDMKENVFVHLPGMENLKEDFVAVGPYKFQSVSKISQLSSSTKTALDVNGNTVSAGDKIEFTITLQNKSGSNLSGVMVSDLTPLTMTIQPESLKCADANCKDSLEWEESGMSLRAKIIKNVSVPANGKRTIKYTSTVDAIPSINFDLGYDFGGYEKDNYPDIRVRPSVNPNGDLIYLYSTGVKESYVNYKKKVLSSAGKGLSDEYDKEFEKNGLPSAKDLLKTIGSSGVPDVIKNSLQEMVSPSSSDKDGSGCPDSWESFKKDATEMGEAVYGAVNTFSNFKCNGGGCLPIPYNYAFLAPTKTSSGYPVISFTAEFPYFAFFRASDLPSFVRLYVSPTLTMGLGTAVCVGPNDSTGMCYATAIPPSVLGGCPNFLQEVNDVIAKAKNVNSDPDIGTSTVISNGEDSTGTDAISFGDSSSSPLSLISVADKVNVRIPGFPSVITDWLDREADEIYNKLLDFPDIYLIIPDFGELGGKFAAAGKNFKKIKSINDFLRAVNSIPFVQIEGKEILVKVPALTSAEIEKWKRQASLWIDYEQAEILKIPEYWGCDENNYRKTFCDKITVNLNSYITSIKTLMDKLDKIAKLPSEVLKFRSLETKYATQIICYMDAIMEFMGGYIKRQNIVAESWMKAVEDAIKIFKDWHMILDISIDYEKSCNECNKNDRFSKLGLLLQFLVNIPDPPTIPLPKWPDIVFDVSQIKTGVRIVWPDVVFMPESINLPDLPTINLSKIALPEIIPDDYTFDISKTFGIDTKFDIPDWIINFPEFAMPNLPDLPNLAFPNLPDLPHPPKIPALSDLANSDVIVNVVTSLKKVIKVLCLLKKGLLPIPERNPLDGVNLATQIETLTQPSAQSVLPFLKEFSVQMPAIEYSYVDQIKVDAKLNFGIDTSFIYYFAKLGADKINKQTDKLIKGLNEYTGLPFQNALNNLVEKFTDAITEKAKEAIEESVSGVGDVTEEVIEDVQKATDNKQSYIPEVFVQLKNELNNFSNVIENYVSSLKIDENYPEKFYLTATQSVLQKDDAVMNKKLSDIKNLDMDFLEEYPEMEKMYAIRNSILAYANDVSQSNEVLSGIKDYDEFIKFIAENTNQKNLFAEDTLQKIDISPADEEIKGSLFSDETKEKMIAYEPGNVAKTDLVSGETGATGAPKGFYIIADGKNESVLNYTLELGDDTNTLFIDVDGDSDKDIIFSMGGAVYMKINHKQMPESEKGDVYVSASDSAVSDFILKDGVNFTSYYTMYEAPLCSDKEPPLPAISQTTFNVSVFQSLVIDAGNSFDPNGEVAEYFVEMLPFENGKKKVTQFPKSIWSDANLSVDENGDGNLINDKSNPKFNIGPFVNEGDVGTHYAIMNVVDASGNSSSQKITINVFAPKISLNQPLERTPAASGKVDPSLPNIPFSLMRERYSYRSVSGNLTLVPRVDKIKTPTIGEDGKYKTDNDGTYNITDFSTDDAILIEDENGKIIAKINPKTGNIGEVADGYEVKVNTSTKVNTASTSVIIVDKAGYVQATVYIVGDINTDINSSDFYGTNVKDLNLDDFIDVKILPSDNKFNPGGAVIVDEKNNIVFGAIEPSGNITILDNRLKATKKKNDYTKDPLVIELSIDGKIVAEVRVNISVSAKIVGAKDVPVPTPSNAAALEKSAKAYVSPFADFGNLSSELKKIANDLYEKDIIEGIKTQDGVYLKPDDFVTRSQFVKILLKMLCIEPRAEAYKVYSPNEANGGFSDISFK